jgi:acetoin utilization protein AcuB
MYRRNLRKRGELMLVERWMTRTLFTVDEEASLAAAIRLLKDHRIRRLPVLRQGRLVGIVSDRDLKEASPSKATSLDIWELHFLLEKLKIKEVMTPNPITVAPEATIEKVALIMLEKRIGGLPVVEASGGALVGIITEDDVFRALVEVTGVRLQKTRIALLIADQAGTIREVADVCREKGAKILSILTTYFQVPPGKRELIMRVDCPDENVLKVALAARFGEVTVAKD